MNNGPCEFIREYEEPKEPYICLATCLFIPEKYYRYKTNGSKNDVKERRQISFQKNLSEQIKNISKLSDKYYFRIYYDNSILKDEKWKLFLNIIKNNKKIQLIRFKCSKFMINDDFHINLFGTLIRMHPYFDEKSNTISVATLDADMYLVDKWYETLNNFIKSDENFLVFQNTSVFSVYKMDYNYRNNNILDYIFFPFGLLISKIKFNQKIWNNLHEIIYNDFELREQINYSDFRKKALTKTSEESYLSFIYGMDEIILNYIFKKIIKKNNYKVKIIWFGGQTYKKTFFSRFIICFEYNKNMNPEFYNKILKKYPNLLSDIKNNNNFDKIIIFFKNNFDDLNKLYINSDLLYFILNYDELKTKFDNSHDFSEFFKIII